MLVSVLGTTAGSLGAGFSLGSGVWVPGNKVDADADLPGVAGGGAGA